MLAAALLAPICAAAILWRAGLLPAGGVAPARFEPGACRDAATDAVELRCGVLVVPESRERPNGREIRLAVTILSPAGVAPGALGVPIVHLAGGPGYGAGMAGEMLAGWLDWYAGWAGGATRALILVDQRGTGLSEPALECADDIAEASMRSHLASPVPKTARARAESHQDFLMNCRAPFDAAGIDVAAYNTAESAADIADLRRSLGIDEWHLWGVSYGTELALEVLRIDESAVRGLILDSVSLYGRPGVLPASNAQTFDRALTQVVRDCLLDEPCKKAHPSMLSRLGPRLTWLNITPETMVLHGGGEWDGAEVVLDGRRASELLFYGMYFSEVLPAMPGILFQLHYGRHEAFNHLAQAMLAFEFYLPRAHVMATSVMCRAAPDENGLARLRDLEGRFPSYAALGSAEHLATICPGWGATPADPRELGPVHSDVPALILAGRYDPVTPPEWGRIVAGWLPNATMLEFPHLAHGSLTIDRCADAVAARFLADPDGDPRDGCLADLRPPAFLLNMGLEIADE